jgi:hypothetical protein
MPSKRFVAGRRQVQHEVDLEPLGDFSSTARSGVFVIGPNRLILSSTTAANGWAASAEISGNHHTHHNVVLVFPFPPSTVPTGWQPTPSSADNDTRPPHLGDTAPSNSWA